MSSNAIYIPFTLGVAAIALAAGYFIGARQTGPETQAETQQTGTGTAAATQQKLVHPDISTPDKTLMPNTTSLQPKIPAAQNLLATGQPSSPATNGLPPQSGQAHLHNKADPNVKFTHFRVGQRNVKRILADGDVGWHLRWRDSLQHQNRRL